MRKVLLCCAAALLLASCEEKARYNFPPGPEAPMAPPQGQPSPRPSAPINPLPPPGSLKPLHVGLLTAKNVGNYMDGEERELRTYLHGSGAGVMRPGDAVTVYLRDDVLFQPNSLDLTAGGAQIISVIAAVAMKYDSTAMSVNGYTDTSGTPDLDMQLSQERADAVTKAMVAAGVDAHRLDTHGFGATHLKIPTGANVNEPRNRRVEIIIRPKMSA